MAMATGHRCEVFDPKYENGVCPNEATKRPLKWSDDLPGNFSVYIYACTKHRAFLRKGVK
jgi:hypothetical protein